MRLRKSTWTMILGVIAFLMLVTIVWASPPASGPAAPLQSTPGLDADKVDGHHAAASWWSAANRANKVLWANASGNVHWKAMPQAALNNRYVNDDRQETITASATGNAFGDAVLNIDNTAPSHAGGMGLYSRVATSSAVRGESGMIGVSGSGTWTYGVSGTSDSGTGGYFESNEGYGVRAISNGTNHWDHAGYFTANWGYGIYAQSTENFAVRGEAGDVTGMWQPTGPVGVVGLGESRGVWGSSGDGPGVTGISTDDYGVLGESDNSYGVASRDGFLTHTGTSYDTGSVDVAEYFPVLESDLEPGEVVIIDSAGGVRLRRATEAYDTRVAGIVSTSPGIKLGVRDGNMIPGNNDGEALIALAGRVPCRVDAGYGPITAGDLLTTSPTAGHAMKAVDPQIGTILGKALEGLDEGTGTIFVLVTLQ